ncbi:MAG: alpha/beta hydrolase, partial [Kofleriaceae bacterium]
RLLAIGPDKLYVDLRGTGDTTVVFEAGFGNDSTVWSVVTPKIHARTFIYDRAGMGKSSIGDEPYSLEHDVTNLLTALDQCHVTNHVIMVGHSYGGAIALMAARDPRIEKIILLDALIPGVDMTAELPKLRAQYDEIRREAPALARVAIPWAEALPHTMEILATANPSQPIIDLVADHGQTQWRGAHEALVAKDPTKRTLRVVESGHKIPVEAPDAVVDAVNGSQQSGL